MTEEDIKQGEKIIKKSFCYAHNKGLETGIDAVQGAFKLALKDIILDIADRELCIDAMEYIKKKAIKELSLTPDSVEIEIINEERGD